ncbi:hypothetical protein DRF75_01765 [Ehrlichia minasensis]|uniref:Transmembrane protein n=2 Tax=Ehrlichia minasensis TaxID=1242993 RepID=A0A4Q6I6S1_9RICK|nr:hypothetical protein DRF75_01765 [Ehrlichia minasensis]
MGIFMVLENNNITDDDDAQESTSAQESTETVSESSSSTSVTQSTRDKKLDNIDFNTLFLAISFVGLLIEAASSTFNLVSTYVHVPGHIKHTVAIAFYVICILASLSMVASSTLAIKQSLNYKHNLQKISTGPSKEAQNNIDEGLLGYGKLKQRQINIKVCENAITIISELSWIIVSAMSLAMITANSGTPELEFASLCLAVLAPFLAFISCALRLSDANISRKTATSTREKRQANNFAVLCGIILVFEAIHCSCHIIEAFTLGGQMQNIYDFQDVTILGLELATICMFIIAFFVEKYLDKRAESSDHGSIPSLLNNENTSPLLHQHAQIS